MNEYNTNIVKLICSCPDWKETRKQYPVNDPRRLCKHIINKLDLNNLPCQIYKFKESIKFYQEKEWGFKRDFDEIIELNDFTLLGNIGWIDVFNKDGIKYSVIKEDFSNKIYWANEFKPKEYKEIEKFLIEESKKIPPPLEQEEYPIIINFIKEVLPHKKNFYISINESSYIPSSDGIIYEIWESKLTPYQEKKLLQELLQEYSKDEAYFHLGKATFTPLGEEHEFRYLIVKNNKITVEMYYGEKYSFKRDYNHIQKLKNAKKQKEEAKIKTAQKNGYVLSEEYDGDLYDFQRIYKHTKLLPLDEYHHIKNSILNQYDTLQNLLKTKSLNITTSKFKKALENLNFIKRKKTLNQNDWIIKSNGLDYGLNLMKNSKYMHISIPDWYKVYVFNDRRMKLEYFDSSTYVKMTSILYKKSTFNELCQMVLSQITLDKGQSQNKVKNTTTNNKKTERERWLRHVNCPNCGEKTNIHKKDKRKRISGYTVQRFYCNECNSMFQMNLDELDKLIQEYEENEIKKEKFTASKETVEIQPVVEKEIEPVKIPKSEEKENNIFKKFFPFFK